MERPDFYYDLSEEERREFDQNALLGDMEFELGVAEQMGPVGRDALDADVAKVVPLESPRNLRSRAPGTDYYQDAGPLFGFYTKPGGDSDDMNEALRYQREALEREGGGLLEDHVYAGSGETADDFLWSHEFRHRGKKHFKEGLNRLWDVYRAPWEDQEEAIMMVSNATGMDEEEVKNFLKENLEDFIHQEAKAANEQDIQVPGLPESPYDNERRMEAYKDFYRDRAEYRHPWLKEE
jgi:hypothetical protein